MAVSNKTAKEILLVLELHLTPVQIDRLLGDLAKVQGSLSFLETIKKVQHYAERMDKKAEP